MSRGDRTVITDANNSLLVRSPIQFRLRTLFKFVTLAAILCSLPVLGRGCYYQERNEIQDLLSGRTDIENVSIHGFDDGIFENVHSTSFNIRNRPNTMIRLNGLDDVESGSFRHLELQQIGHWTFIVGGYGHIGVRETATGKPAKTDFWKNSVDIGSDSNVAMLVPFKVSTLDQLIENYDRLVAYFETWPKEDEPGRIKLEDGTERYYYAIRVGK